MTSTEYRLFGNAQLCRLLMQSKQGEADLRQRVGARANPAGQSDHAEVAVASDPVRKRLAFLLQKVERQRRGAESELATRGGPECPHELA